MYYDYFMMNSIILFLMNYHTKQKGGKHMSNVANAAKGINTANACNGSGDVLAASVINQKTVTQSVQQALVLAAAQVLNIIEAQFGFATNDDRDSITI